ncbi:caffeic acid 3-O-methyltransferase-like protein [Tanacetum coccineum]
MGTNEDQFTYAMQLVTSTSLTMVLVSSIKLKVLDAIAEAGPHAQLSAHEIATRLSIPNQNAPAMIDRMLRLLASHSVVTCKEGVHDSKLVRVYGLTPIAKYFIPNEDGVSLGVVMELATDKIQINSWLGLTDSVMEGGVSFDKIYGARSSEYPALDARFNALFNKAMVDHTTIMMKEVLERYHGFKNIKSMVDVGGGLGVTLNMIVSKYPAIKGINFDQPHVIQHAPIYPGITHVAGNMFDCVPQGDVIFMKWLLGNVDDDQGLKLLRNCYNALPDDGKVILIEAILPFLSDTSSATKVTTQMDTMLMTKYSGGKERTEDEYLALFKGAGFTRLEKKCLVCNLWVMEFYK